MKTHVFIGSQKNAGKTTSIKFFFDKLIKKNLNFCITSIGLNGEQVDNFNGNAKPTIILNAGNYFVTQYSHVGAFPSYIKILKIFSPPQFSELYVLGQVIISLPLIIEGPNSKEQILIIKKQLINYFKNQKISLLIDGSINRQFLGHPDIADEIYLSIFSSSNPENLKYTQIAIRPFTLPNYNNLKHVKILKKYQNLNSTVLLFDSFFKLIHHSKLIASQDLTLLDIMTESSRTKVYLYLNSTLNSNFLNKLLKINSQLTIILNNFTLFKFSLDFEYIKNNYFNNIYLLHKTNLNSIFIRQEGDLLNLANLKLPKVSIYNIFRDNLDEINFTF